LVQGTLMITDPHGSPGFELLDGVLALGCNTFDTARVYGGGTNEGIFGQWVRERGVRDQVVVIGKGAHPKDGRKRVTPADISADIKTSLKEFKFDYIDFYLLHRDDEDQPVGPIVETLNEHLKAGHIHAFGGSNWKPERVKAANDYAFAHNLTPFVASSPNFSLADQVKEPWPGCVTISGPQNDSARAWYEAERMPLFTWSSLAGGFFSGRFTHDNLDTFDNYYDQVCVQSYCYDDNFRRLDRARQLADELNLTIPQVALAYVMSAPLDIYALVGCNTPDEFRANLAALDVKLDDKTRDWLDLRRDDR
ncbi:MAG: aldo/keto reductase, partial [Anaerolineae bacterium]|nr:aldo/keto reductase [Anaerolineae bacterium]